MSGDELLQAGAQLFGIFADQHVGTLLDGFYVLGIAVESDAGNVVEGGFLGHVAGVGDDAHGMGREVAELKIGQRFGQRQPVSQRADDKADGRTQGRYDGNVTGNVADSCQHALEVVGVGKQRLAVDGEHQIAAVGNSVETGRALPAVVLVAQGIHEDVAHHIYLMHLGTFTRSNAAGNGTGGKQQVAEAVDDQAVDFLRHADVERARASHEVRQAQSALLGHDSCGHGGGKVVDNNHGVGGVVLQVVLEGSHNTASELVQILAVDTQEDIGLRHLQVVEQRRLQRAVGLTAGIHQPVADALGLSDNADNWGDLHEIGSGAGEDTDFVFHSNK